MADSRRLPQQRAARKPKATSLESSLAGFTRSETLLPLLVERQRTMTSGSAELGGNQLGAQSEPLRPWEEAAKCWTGKTSGKRAIKTKRVAKPGNRTRLDKAAIELSPLDERVFFLYHSYLTYGRQTNEFKSGDSTEAEHLLNQYGPEATYAAIKIQKVTRGILARNQLAAFHGPKNQYAAEQIQFAFRRSRTRHRTVLRLRHKRRRMAIRIQAWYRGCCGRDYAMEVFANRLNSRIANFQRRFRGLRFWRVVSAALHKRKWDAAREVQRIYRGWRGRCYSSNIRFEKNRFAQELRSHALLHAQYPRCEGCTIERCNELSLFRCFMARYLGLHDFVGARMLGEQGVTMFPSSAIFVFVYGVLLQSICDDLETSAAFLTRAKSSGLQLSTLDQCEEQFFQAALMLYPDDVAVHLDLAIFFQSRDEPDRALLHYEKAFAQAPLDYAVPGYLNRVRMVDRLLMNYHRFCSVFNYRQVNVLVKDVLISKRGPKVRLCVAKLNHYTIICPIELQGTCKINAVYLADEELIALNDNGAVVMKVDGSSQISTNDNNRGFLKLSEWRNNSSRATVRRSSSFKHFGHARTASKRPEPHYTQPVITQVYQDEFLGLHMSPQELSKYSETRSRLILTKENAEALLKLVKFIELSDSDTEQKENQVYNNMDNGLYRVMVIPQILRKRFDHLNHFRRSHASIAIQSAFRGFRFRAEMRRERLLYNIHQRQVDEVLAKLQNNFIRRERRRINATSIQRIVRGVQQRHIMAIWRSSAIQIQRVYRGFLGRKRAIAFREGSFTFYMVDRVFQRGVEISDRYLVLSIDQCGLSFRFDAYDVESCESFHGFLSHQSLLALLCYKNWLYAKSFQGCELELQSQRVRILDVASINPSTGECNVRVEAVTTENRIDGSATAIANNFPQASSISEVALVDCVNSINLRNVVTGMHEDDIELPLKQEDSKRLVKAIVERLVLVPSLAMATHELRSKNTSDLILAVAPPPAMHFTFNRQIYPPTKKLELQNRKSNLKKLAQTSKNTTVAISAPIIYPRHTVFPVVDGLRGVSVGKDVFRKKCERHSAAFTRCRCVLPLVSTPSYVESLRLALAPPLLLSYLQVTKSDNAQT